MPKQKSEKFLVDLLKRKESEFTELYNRPVIGKIGIGFIAVSELCEQIKITSAKKGSGLYFEAMIDFARFRRDERKGIL